MPLDIAALQADVNGLITFAETELEEQRLQQERTSRINETIKSLEPQLRKIQQSIQAKLTSYANQKIADSLTKSRLEEQLKTVEEKLSQLDLVAMEIVDADVLKQEERLLERQLAAETQAWREELKLDLLEALEREANFFAATDAAVEITQYLDDLKAINALGEVAAALVEAINRNSDQGLVAKHRRTDEHTIRVSYEKAMENRGRANQPRVAKAKTNHRQTEQRPNPYQDLQGKVVVVGGHAQLETHVRKRLLNTAVEVFWCSATLGSRPLEQTMNQLESADLVLLLTGPAAHPESSQVINAAKRVDKEIVRINCSGLTRILEAIAYGLKAKQLIQAPGLKVTQRFA